MTSLFLKTLALMIISPPIHHTVPPFSSRLSLPPPSITASSPKEAFSLPPLSLWVLTGFHVKYGDAPKASVSNTDLMWMFHPPTVSFWMGKRICFTSQLLFPKHLLCLSYQTDQSTFLSSPSSLSLNSSPASPPTWIVTVDSLGWSETNLPSLLYHEDSGALNQPWA